MSRTILAIFKSKSIWSVVNLTVLLVVFLAGVLVGSKWPFDFNFFQSDDKAVYHYTFSGEGSGTVGPFTLADGLVFVTIRNQAGRNDYLGANIYFDEDGDKQRGDGDDWVEQLVNVGYEDAETFDGTIPVKVSQGDYFIDIDGARWQIEIIQPAVLNKPASKFAGVSGKGPKVSSKFYLTKGEHKFRAVNSGDSNFIIYLVDEKGNFSSRLVNEIGKFDGEFTTKVVIPDNYLFYVYSNGDWQIVE